MSLSTLRVATLLVGVALIAMVVLTLRREINAPQHARYTRALRQAQQLDARLSEEIAKSRLGVVTHYDGLVALGDRIAAIGRELERTPSYVRGGHRQRLAAKLAAYGKERGAKAALVERFKTGQSVLRNSVRAFPHTLARVLSSLHTIGTHERLARLLRRLERNVTLLVISPTRARSKRARCALAALGVAMVRQSKARERHRDSKPCPVGTIEAPPQVAGALQLALRHARLIVEQRPHVAAIVKQIVTLPVARRAAAALEVATVTHASAMASARTHRLAIFALALALLALTATYIIVRLQGTAKALRETTGRLEAALAQLEVERDRANELAELKSRFVAMVSHETKTPLARILSSAEMLSSYGAKWPQHKRERHIERVQDATKEMSQLIDSVLLIGRAEAGMLELKPEPLSLREVCDEVVEDARALTGRSRQIEVDVNANGATVWLDHKLVRHVLSNLLINAFKYSADDSVVRFAVDEDGEAARFVVQDSGMGIPAEDLPHLFEAFHRGANTGSIPGTGLGLAVVKKSVEVHGGSIDVESEVGRGTTFSVRIPFAEGDQEGEVVA